MTNSITKWVLAIVGLAILLVVLGTSEPIYAVSPPSSSCRTNESTAIITFTSVTTQPQSSMPAPTDWIAAQLTQDWLLAGLICVSALLILALLLLVLNRRHKKSEPAPASLAKPSPAPPTSMYAYLESTTPDGPRRLDLNPRGTNIGRASENELIITPNFPNWDTVSHRHARVYQQGQRWIIEDINSMNGIYVNGKRTGRNILQDGWQVDIGGVSLVFRTGIGEA